MNAVLNKIPKSTMIIILIVLTLTVISVVSVFLIKTYGIYAWSAEGKIINEVYAVSVGDKELGLTATKDDADKVAERLKGENTPEGISQVTTNVTTGRKTLKRGVHPRAEGNDILLKKKCTVVVTGIKTYKQKRKYKTVKTKTDKLIKGDRKIEQKGRNGLVKVTEKIKYENGKPVYSKKTRKTIKKSKNKIIKIGIAVSEDGSGDKGYKWNGIQLTRAAGTVIGPSGKETYYNLPMGGVVSSMRSLGFSEKEYPYKVRRDGVKTIGGYVMVAANLQLRPKGTFVKTSRGMGIVCDTGSFAYSNKRQLDLAVDW